ncbi:sigma-54-dependent transcriptional regulator [Rhodothermus profundi]|uniref:DNA-binding transcriptional response regulator, NtrC family, contains REC, AAA-type ATPase, and a Fis-type DNA-binding domains n=1 Tax=Rhodothermus profundi TaxID=633813 RepID=A0A1M6PS16_9BACT|nr:sigma-54 dependent transcriptional regulator [Rhodothermus profundi]SHK10672.1 DNA-binding transcriptional response regulator, NtrC family, contains REC, AAA-type ATPase, and a Fis-type DNA-binding domains [Rhodothermus profundi]
MQHTQTIALARSLLAEGRSGEVARMLSPLIEPLPAGSAPADSPQPILRALLARVRLLRQGDVSSAYRLLKPLDVSTLREHLSPAVRAEVALWLGWLHAWPENLEAERTRAFNLLAEAERFFHQELNTAGRCWVQLGRALAYLTIDEYALALQALDEAAALKERLPDLQADGWIQDLGVQAALLTGRYHRAERALRQLQALAERTGDTLLKGRALAYQALLKHVQGGAPAEILATVEAAEALLSGLVPLPHLLWLARAARLAALRRQGHWREIDRLLQRWSGSDARLVAHPILLEAAELALLREDFTTCEQLLERMLTTPAPAQSRLLATRAALLQARHFLRRNQLARAREWADRAHRTAQELGLEPLILEALLVQAQIALAEKALSQAQMLLQQAEVFSNYFSLLPWAAWRFWLLGERLQAEGQPDEARAHYVQALSAYSLLGDRYHTAQMQLAVAQLVRSTDSAQARSLLEAAAQTFEALGVASRGQQARHMLQHLPHQASPAALAPESQLGNVLARAALSVELVAEAWLQVLEQLWPDRWLAVFQHTPEGEWTSIRAHGEAPAPLSFPSPDKPQTYQDGVAWLQLRALPGPVFFMAARVAEIEYADWQAIVARLRPWLPVVALALDHALLRARQFGELANGHAPEDTQPSPLEDLVYASPTMRALVNQIYRVRSSHSPVLILGESGTGKELIARAVHATSDRREAPFIAFNCANVPPELIDSHLFGHEKGAFTGALQANPGVIRAADGGTLFLDEIGDLPLEVQPKLLRFLQEGEIFPLGARRPVRVNVRVIAATHRDLEALVREGKFREDLYYRLNVIPLYVPPLRERREDIPVLVRHFLNTLRPPGAPAVSITSRAMEALMRYDWPGNVRQLRNEIERALVFVASEPAPTIDLKDLSPVVQRAQRDATAPLVRSAIDSSQPLEAILADTEKALIEQVLADHRGRISAAARALGLTRQGLYKKMKRLGIDPGRFQHRRASTNPTATS